MRNLRKQRVLSAVLAGTLLASAVPIALAAEEDVEEVTPSVLSAFVPATLPLKMDAEGNVFAPTNAVIMNGSTDKAIQVKGITVEAGEGWTAAAYADDFTAKEENSAEFAFKFRSDEMQSDGSLLLTTGDWQIPADDSLKLNMSAKIPKQTEMGNKGQIATVHYVLDWADEFTLTPINGENGTINDTTPLQTDAGGTILSLPEVTSAEGYKLYKWVNAETYEEVKVGDVITSDITITPLFTLDDADKVVSAIAVQNPPEKVIYAVGENFNPMGMAITVTYEDGTTAATYSGYEIIDGDALTLETAVVTISYRDQTCEQAITVKNSYTISFEQGENGTIDATPLSVLEDETVTLPTPQPDEGYQFVEWTNAETGEAVDTEDLGSADITLKPKFEWVVVALTIPTQSGSLVYTGEAQSPEWDDNYNSELMEVSVSEQTAVGTYSATFTLKDVEKYTWADGTTDTKTVSWEIQAVQTDDDPEVAESAEDIEDPEDTETSEVTETSESDEAAEQTENETPDASESLDS